MPLLERRRIIGEHAMISHIALRRGFTLDSHTHHNEQISVVLEGAIRFGVGAPGSPEHRIVVVRSGEILVLPANCPHSAEALEDTLVLDVFSPPSTGTGIDRGEP
jgi:quercetin dioxygenase-like cupin family protein